MKFALLIGSNYKNIPNARLYGCINDIINIKNMLIDAYDYNTSNIIMLRDDNPGMLPTRENIINKLTYVINESANYEELWIHYSGHGSQIVDDNFDEVDGKDEVIVPCDFQKEGFITDDMIFNIIKNSKCRTIIVMDCCNSGSLCDLQWSFENNETTFVKNMNPNREIINPNIFMISGCKDDQSSSDIYDQETNQSCGALTSTFIKCLRNSNHNIGLFNLYDNICDELISSGFLNQLPILSSSYENPQYTFQKPVIIKMVTENVNTNQSVPITKFEQIHEVLGKNMVSVMVNKTHRDPNKYKPKKQR
jgi:metacaspase-1